MSENYVLLFHLLIIPIQLKLYWINKFNWAIFENHLDVLLSDCANGREEETQIHHSHNFLWKRILSNKQNINHVIISVTVLIFKKQVIVWDLSMMKKITSWRKEPQKLKKKNEKSWKLLKMYIIINFKTIRCKVTALGNIIHLILNYKLMRLVNTLRLPKE